MDAKECRDYVFSAICEHFLTHLRMIDDREQRKDEVDRFSDAMQWFKAQEGK